MRSQTERDQQTVTIATGLVIFVGVLLAGLLLGVLLNAIEALSAGVTTSLGFVTVILAVILTIAYLVRHRRS